MQNQYYTIHMKLKLASAVTVHLTKCLAYIHILEITYEDCSICRGYILGVEEGNSRSSWVCLRKVLVYSSEYISFEVCGGDINSFTAGDLQMKFCIIIEEKFALTWNNISLLLGV